MNFLFITQFFPPPDAPNQTGGTISNRNFLRFLARDNKVTVLTFDPSAVPHLFAKEKFEVVQRIPPPWRALNLFLHWQTFVRNETNVALEGVGKPDFLIATTSTLAAFDVAPSETKCIAVVQAFENFGASCSWVPLHTRIALLKGAIIHKFQDRRLMLSADGVLTNSNFMKKAIASHFSIPLKRIHVCVQQVDFSPSIKKPLENSVGFVHRGPDKNISHVFDLALKAPDLEFLVYGHGSGLPVDHPVNVSIVGWTTDRASMFASAQLWIVPSLWAEPFGRVSIEAQAAGRAVLVANRGGLSETVADRRYLIDGFAVDDWLERIRLLLSLSETEILDAGQRVNEMFSTEAHDKSVQRALHEIITLNRRVK